MLKSCQYCGRIHPKGYECPQRPKRRKKKESDADRFRRTAKWQDKRRHIVERDFHMCRICNEGSYDSYPQIGSLEVHHIEPLEEQPELALLDDNLVTTCSWHHKMAEAGKIPREYLHHLAGAPPRWDIGPKSKIPRPHCSHAFTRKSQNESW